MHDADELAGGLASAWHASGFTLDGVAGTVDGQNLAPPHLASGAPPLARGGEILTISSRGVPVAVASMY